MATLYFGTTLINQAAANVATVVESLTKAEYEALAVKDPNTLYVLTDAENDDVGTHNTDPGAHADIREDVDGKVSKAGDTMTGDLTVEKDTPRIRLVDTTNNFASRLETGNHFTYVTALNDPSSTQNYRALMVCDSDNDALVGALKLRDKVDGTVNLYNVIHTGNKNLITPADIGAAEATHNQAASTITSGTFDAARIPTLAASKVTSGTFAATGVKAKSGTDYTTARVRNIQASTTDLTAGTSTLASGDLYFVYE